MPVSQVNNNILTRGMQMVRHIRKHIALYSLIGLVTLIAACGSSGGGGGDDGGGGGGQTPLATGTFIKTEFESATIGSYPFNFNKDTNYRVMHLYDVNIKENPGRIKAIAFRANSTTASPTVCSDITIKMGHTSVTTLSATFASNVEQGKGTLETVLANAPVVIPPVNAGDYITIQLDKAFYYNG